MLRVLISLVLAGCAGSKDSDTGGEIQQETGQGRATDADRDGSDASEDCDDGDPNVHPGADETCDGVDNDCDGLTDDADDSLSAETWYTDADGDGYGDDATGVLSCEAGEGVNTGGDCDDADPDYHPGADESDCANPADYNCDGSSGYTDADADGFGACEECDDGDPLSYPGAEETCDEADNDCDGLTDDADEDVTGGSTWYGDADADGYGDDATTSVACAQPEGSAASGGDCDDADPAFNPGASETDCTDPNDYDCDGTVAYSDEDGDGYAACVECDDGVADVNPGAVEICDDLDNDCDGLTDDADEDVKGGDTFYADGDGDGYGDADSTITACELPSGYSALSTDCDDADADVHPGATEICDDQDNDCDTYADDADSGLSGGSTWYRDVDGDGYGSSATTKTACDAPTGYVSTSGDCLDSNSAIHPGASEICDDLDNDCDTYADDADASVSGTSTWYRDGDSDGYGGTTTSSACDRPSGYVATDGDCDDTDSNTNPGETEICNDDDDDCDTLVDEDDPSLEGAVTAYVDDDLDGYGDESATVELCALSSGYTTTGEDCDDTDPDVNPDEKEDCDAVDNDCTGYADDGDECPCYVEYHDDHPYMYCTTTKSWSSAKSYCEGYGYTLATIDDSSEDDWVYENTRSYSRYGWWWIGYTDSAVEDTWVWSDGESSTYTDWASGEPSDSYYYEKDCAVYSPSWSSDWYATSCSYYVYFVCEAE